MAPTLCCPRNADRVRRKTRFDPWLPASAPAPLACASEEIDLCIRRRCQSRFACSGEFASPICGQYSSGSALSSQNASHPSGTVSPPDYSRRTRALLGSWRHTRARSERRDVALSSAGSSQILNQRVPKRKASRGCVRHGVESEFPRYVREIGIEYRIAFHFPPEPILHDGVERYMLCAVTPGDSKKFFLRNIAVLGLEEPIGPFRKQGCMPG